VRDIAIASHTQGEANKEFVAQMQLLECAARVRAARQQIALADAISTLDTRIAPATSVSLNASTMQQGAPR
jgi:hypothetical protein